MSARTAYRLLLAALLAAAAATAQADVPTVTSRLEPDSIFIGDRFDFVIEVEKDVVQTVAFPAYRPDPRSGLELVADPAPDTLEREGRRIRLRKRYTLAAFEEGLFDMGRASVLYADKNIVDTLYADDASLLRVATFVIDSASQAPFDLKPQKTLRFRFGEIGGWLSLALALLLVAAGALWLLVRWLDKRGRSLGSLFAPAPPLPPHIVAIKALEELRNRKLWQNNRHKLYYSELGDILRTYISARYGIGAMEMTTDETLEALRPLELAAKPLADLTTLLRNADLVKFAKWEPEAAQNEADFDRAYWFVEETKECDPSTAGEKELLDQKLDGR